MRKNSRLLLGGVAVIATSSVFFYYTGTEQKELDIVSDAKKEAPQHAVVLSPADTLAKEAVIVSKQAVEPKEDKVAKAAPSQVKPAAFSAEKLTKLSPVNKALVDAVNEGRPLSFEIGGVKRKLLLAPKNIWGEDAKISAGDGSFEIDPNESVHLFAGVVVPESPSVVVSGDSETIGNVDSGEVSNENAQSVVLAQAVAQDVVPESGMKAQDLLEQFDAVSSNMTIIGDQMVMSMSNEQRDRLFIRFNPETAEPEMRFEPYAMHEEQFGECTSEACGHDHSQDQNDPLYQAALDEIWGELLADNGVARADMDEWIRDLDIEIHPDGTYTEVQGINIGFGKDPSGESSLQGTPLPFGPKYQESLRNLNFYVSSEPELLADPVNPTAEDVGSMLCRLLLSLEGSHELYERGIGINMLWSEIQVRKEGDEGNQFSARTGTDNMQSKGVIYGWGGPGAAAGSSWRISAWPVGICHEIGHTLGLGHTGGDLMASPPGGAHFWGFRGARHSTAGVVDVSAMRVWEKVNGDSKNGAVLRGRGILSQDALDGEDNNVSAAHNSNGRTMKVPFETPIAENDAYATAVDTAVEFDPRVNDDRQAPYSPYYNERITVEEIGRIIPRGAGTVEILDQGERMRFTPAPGFEGVAYFNYSLRGSVGNGGQGWLSRAPVAITVGNPVADPTNITLVPGEDRWVGYSASLTQVDYPTMANLRISGKNMILRAKPDATGSETFTVSIGGTETEITVNYDGAGRSTVDDLIASDNGGRLRFNPLLNDEVAGGALTENNITVSALEVLNPLTDKNNDFKQSYRLISATLTDPAMGTLEVEQNWLIFPDGSTGSAPTGYLLFDPAENAHGYATINYVAEDVDGTQFNGTARVLVGMAEVVRPARKYTHVRQDMGLVLETDQAPAVGAEFSGTSTLLWTVLDQPSGSNVSFDDATSANAVVRFDTPGRYRLELAATDNGQVKRVERWIFVDPADAEMHSGFERAPWVDATRSELSGWNQGSWNTSELGVSVTDDGFSNVINLAPYGTASWVAGTNGREANEIIRPTVINNEDLAKMGLHEYAEHTWELDLGADKLVNWVDIYFGRIGISDEGNSGYSSSHGVIVELLDASRTVIATKPVQSEMHQWKRFKLPLIADGSQMIRYVRVMKPATTESLPLIECRVMGQENDLADLTRAATPRQSTTHNNDNDFDAWRAIDFKISNNFGAMTDSTSSDNWWEIEFDDESELRQLRLILKSVHTGATITAYNAQGTQTWQSAVGSDEVQYFDNIPENTMAKRVRVAVADGAVEQLAVNELYATGVKPNPLTHQWSQVDAGSAVNFGSPNAVDSTVTLPASGDYVLRLTSDDGWNKTVKDFPVNYDASSTGPQGYGLDDINVSTSGDAETIDLFAAFDDAETADGSMSYEVVNVSNAGLFATDPTGAIADPANFSLATVAGSSGSSTVTVRATDGNGNSTELTFDVNAENQPPSAPAVVEVSLDEIAPQGTVIVDLKDYVTDPDGDTLVFGDTVLKDNFTEGISRGSDGVFTVVGDLFVIERTEQRYTYGLNVSDGVNPPVGFTFNIILNDSNRAPDVLDQALSIPEVAIPGSTVTTMALGELNEKDETYTWSIASGNTDGDWTIDPATGAVSLVNALDANRIASYALVIEATDTADSASVGSATLTIDVGLKGFLSEEVFEGVAGVEVVDLTNDPSYPDSPTSRQTVAVENFDFQQTVNDYGRRVRGYLTVPESGDYTFHMAANDRAQFFLSTDEDPANAVNVLELTAAVVPYNFSSTPSAPISLVAGQRYYFDVLHKENTGGDHLTIAWTGPGGLNETIIAGEYLQAYDDMDGDGLNDWWETTYIGNLDSDGSGDADQDGLSDLGEQLAGTNPGTADFDGDGYADGVEVRAGSNPGNAQSTPSTPLVLFYGFDGTEGSTDPISGVTGTLQVNAALGADGSGHSGQAGDQALELGTFSDGSAFSAAVGGVINAVTANDEITVSFWIKQNAINKTSAFWMASPSNGGTQRGFQAHVPWSSGAVIVDVAGSSGTARLSQGSGGTDWTQWQHVAIVKNGTTMELWVGGSLLGSKADTRELPADIGELIVGAGFDGTSYVNSLDGQLDEFAVFKQALTSVEIADLAAGTSAMEIFADNNTAPTVDDATFAVVENGSAGEVLGSVAASDPDGDALTYQITAGNDAGLFAISSTGEVTTTAGLDYEAASQHVLTVTVTDTSLLSDTATVTVNVTDVTGEDSDSDGVIDELELAYGTDPNDPASTPVIEAPVFAGVDSVFTTSGAVNGTPSYVVTVDGITMTVLPESDLTDPDLLGFGSGSIGVTNRFVNDGEKMIFSFDKDVYLRAFDVGSRGSSETDTLTSTAFDGLTGVVGADTYDDATDSLTKGGDFLGLDDSNDYDGIFIPAGTPIDFTVSAGGSISYKGLTVVAANSASVSEDVSIGTEVASAVATDAQVGEVLTYEITAGNDSSLFAIDANGAITTAAALDFATASRHVLTVSATDLSGLSASTVVVINVTEVSGPTNTAPTANNASFSIAENGAANDAVGTVTASDPENDTLSYAITAGNESGLFAINSASGTITATGAFDHEASSQYVLTVEVSDGEFTDIATITVNVSNVNEAPVASDLAGGVNENLADGQVIGTVGVTDPDSGDSFTYTITGGNASGHFAIDSNGQVTTTTALDFEVANAHVLSVEVTDAGGLTDTATVNVTVGDVNEAPSTSDLTGSVAENGNAGDVVGTLPATDPDGDALNYQITGGSGAALFAIDSNGQITANSALDHEATNQYSLAVSVSDAEFNDTASVTINVSDVNEAPSASDLAGTVAENGAAGEVIGSVAAIDPEGDFLTYQITAGNDSGLFAIDANGEVTTTGALDFEAESQHVLTVEVSDGALTGTATVTVDVTEDVLNITSSGTAIGGVHDGVDLTLLGNDDSTNHSGSAADMIDNDLSDVYDTFNSNGAQTHSYVGLTWAAPRTDYVGSIELDIATYLDGGWFGVNQVGPGAGATLVEPTHISAATLPEVQVTTDGGATWTTVASTTDYLSQMNGQTIGGGANPNPKVMPTVRFDLDTPITGINGIRVIGTEGGTASKGFVGVAELNVFASTNTPPTADDTTFSIAENGAANDVVGSVTANDNEGDSLTYQITAGNDAGLFAIDTNGQITAMTALDSEAASQHVLTVEVSDGAFTETATITVDVTDVNEAPSASDAGATLAENGSAGAAVATVAATDPENDALNYAITAGNNAALFAIDSSGNVTTTGALDFETASQHVLTVEVSDSVLTDTATVTVDVTNVNEAPVASGFTGGVNENLAGGQVIGTVGVSDADAGDSFSYAIVAGNAAGLFAIDSNGQITTTAALDFENANAYGLTVEVTDAAGLTDAANVTVTVGNVNEAPSALGLTNAVAENGSAGAVVGSVGSSDPDGDNLTYQITGGNASGLFAIDANGQVTTTGALDYEAASQHVLTVQVSDGEFSDTATVTVNVIDVNEAPTASNASGAVAENGSAGAVIGTVTSSDPEGDALSYQITAGNASGLFAIDANGQVTTTGALDYEAASQHVLTVQVSDGELSDTATVTVNVTDVNEAPTASNASGSVAENGSAGAVIGTVAANDIDGDNLTYQITAGNASGLFAIDANGQITTTGALDYEAASQYVLTVQVSDGELSDTATVTVNVTDVNEAPTASNASGSVAENGSAGAVIGTVATSDPEGDNLTYQITAGNASGHFAIDANGQVTTTGALDFEAASQHVLTVQVSDGELSDTATVTVNVTDVNEAPTASNASGSVAENGSAGDAVATVSATDPENGALTYAITGGNASGLFAINASGQVTTTGALDFEAASSHTLTVEVTDAGNLKDTATVAVSVTNVNEAPSVANTSASIAEDTAVGTTVVSVSASDPDADASLSYSITAGNTGNAFSIDSSGNIKVASALDYETTTSYNLTVQVSDGSLTDTAQVTVNVTDVVEVTVASIATGSASNISMNSADAGYSITDDGNEAPTVTLYYGESDGGQTTGAWANSTVIGTQAAGSYAEPLTGLTEGSDYFYTVSATNSAGTAWGSTASFTTEADTTPKLVRTTVSGVSSSTWTTVDLGQNYNSAVIVATPMYTDAATTAPAVTRIRNVSGSSFELKLDRTDALTDEITLDVSVIAVEEGVYTLAEDGVQMEAVTFTSTATASKSSGWSAEARTFQNSYTAPVVVGQVMSYNDANWSTFWSTGSSRTSPVDAANLNVGKHVGEDLNTTRADETVGYIVIETGSGSINGVAYEAALGADTIRSFGNSATPYSYSLSGSLATPSAAALSISGMDGQDGAWAILSGATPLTSSVVQLYVIEDRMRDSDNAHTTTQVGYLIVE